jgi:hypothetical protein
MTSDESELISDSTQSSGRMYRGGWLPWFLLLIIALKVGLILGLGPMPLERDARGYWDLSTEVLGGDGWMLGSGLAYRTPAYPWYLAACRAAWGIDSLAAVIACQGVMLVATVWLTAELACCWSGLPAARWLTLLLALPAVTALTFGRAVLTETLFTFCLTAHWVVMARAKASPSAGKILLGGLALTAAVLTRPIAVLLPVVDLCLWVAQSKDRRLPWSFFILMLVVMVAGLSPWMLRNHHLFQRASLTEFLGRNLWVVTFQEQAGAGFGLPGPAARLRWPVAVEELLVQPGERWRSTWEVSRCLVASGMNDAEADRWMLRVSLEAVASDPWRFGWRAARRILDYWRCVSTYVPYPASSDESLEPARGWRWHNPWLERWVDHRWSLSVIFNSGVAVVSWLSVVVLMGRKRTRGWGIWAASILAYFAVCTGILEIPDYRYRLVVEPVMMAAAAAALASLWEARIRFVRRIAAS